MKILTPQEMAVECDKHFDAMLVDGMSEQEIEWVQEQRRQAHDAITRQAVQAAIGGGDHRRIV